MLELRNLTKRFGPATAVSEVTLTIPAGQMVGVIGRSGAGKSTLLRMLNRLEDPSGGGIVFNGLSVDGLKGRELRRWRSRCAMIFQQFNLVPRLDVLTNVLLGRIAEHRTLPSLFKRFSDAERTMAMLALERLDLADKALQRADTLSGGQQQRVAIARAMMQQPELLLADEPIASLDPRSAAKVMDALRAINREDGITVICNLHTLDTARQYCDRIIAMFHGQVVFDDVPDALTRDTVRRIYGVEDDAEGFREELTSNSGWLRPGAPLAHSPALV
ncbi:phosphonate ABC transporter ATP-binding protein [Azoarcus taiwanensis]|uniref:Phosphonate ABC transporter ATP-binding protein n=1 Tax=Azoarcus taiwanensis TaxID=666964 RepID=A0A972FGT7_9RHOO|nr:phosphonate ABC transporter ATP-binding protein [Azoarcus taiwanensis]NMG04455.1 phosphonate ABC transporter ATP-binding protein [Azoarcus taiwanensis]